ncbi:hypothetical protein E2C01_100210 [Portunus trituberculatus]|uniref:Uncharacterized protein n=1 Tax=Portunus trituberculatus TaxID=210409 RepID=A0A5B7KCE9_PORTR|nr:hypothetical protein [Portunus trituberculatus]
MPCKLFSYPGIRSHQGEWLVLIQKNPHLFLRLSESLSMSLSSPILCFAPASGLAKVSCLPSVPRPYYYSAVQGHYEPLAAYCRCHANNEYLFLSSTCLAVCLSSQLAAPSQGRVYLRWTPCIVSGIAGTGAPRLAAFIVDRGRLVKGLI